MGLNLDQRQERVFIPCRGQFGQQYFGAYTHDYCCYAIIAARCERAATCWEGRACKVDVRALE